MRTGAGGSQERLGTCVGDLLKAWRARCGLTQFEVASRASISTRHLSFLETGRARASAAALDRLGIALSLLDGEADRLRLAAGYAPRSAAPATPITATFDETLFSAAAELDEVDDLQIMLGRTRPILASLGIRQFFFGEIRRCRRNHRVMTWSNPGTFPPGWLRHYDAQDYAREDPLLAAAERHRRGFFWTEATAGGALPRGARRMFDEAASAGIVSGFVVPLHRRDGGVDFVSMMGAFPEPSAPRIRLGLQTIGLQMLFRQHGHEITEGDGLPAR
jgi:transcriptional regulator with XRE-family HTH domain